MISNHKGLFCYTIMPFGVALASEVFQREIYNILQGLKAVCYLDDVLFYGKNEDEHLWNLSAVLSRLQEAGMKLNPDKCEFLKTSVEYLAHRIDDKGLNLVESKVEAITKAPEPRNVDELHSFLGLITYYEIFLPNMAILLALLYELLKSKTTWKWAGQQKVSFIKVKEKLRNSCLLIHFDNEKEAVLASDASPYGLGAVLSNETDDCDCPIAYYFKVINEG